jgi:mRNA interferase RelE/StbE
MPPTVWQMTHVPLGAFPYGSDDLLRIRIGRYRILYEIDVLAQSITILHVGRLA